MLITPLHFTTSLRAGNTTVANETIPPRNDQQVQVVGQVYLL
jgi:hypothetical protein